MDDEPLSEWAARRDARIGELRAVPLGPSGGGAHRSPEAPRAIERWNGYAWESYALASDLAEARRILFPGAQTPPSTGSTSRALAPGSGRHRKPQAPRSGPR
ncbi:DUF6087 family protein [Kitasatospora sp. NPDC001574]